MNTEILKGNLLLNTYFSIWNTAILRYTHKIVLSLRVSELSYKYILQLSERDKCRVCDSATVKVLEC